MSRPTRWITRTAAVAVVPVALMAPVGATSGHAEPGRPLTAQSPPDAGRQVLADRDGWASAGSGTSGGSAATANEVITVHSRDELAAAVTGDQPKIVYVDGTIDANTDDAGNRLSCADYARDGYTLDSYLETYDPDTWGRDKEPSGPVEDARVASQRAQAERVRVRIGSNTTIIGRAGAKITGAQLELNGVSNVILRGLTVTDAQDCFPGWDPTDGTFGHWNSEYDLITLRGSTNVWVDHNDLSDGDNPDSEQPVYFGQPYQVHDGALDITNSSDLVTVSYNRIHDHDKTMLIGSSDSRTADRGKLRVTLHHNEFRNVLQRAPRVRFGQVDVYNNHVVADEPGDLSYSWGVGVESQIVAEHNALTLAAGVGPGQVISYAGGTS